MVIRVTLKDPDTMSDTVKEAVEEHVKKIDALSSSEKASLVESRSEEITDRIVRKWMEYGEYLVVDFDTEAMTATVVPNG